MGQFLSGKEVILELQNNTPRLDIETKILHTS